MLILMHNVGHVINGAMRDVFIGGLLKPIFGIINIVYKTIISIAQTPIISGEVVYDIFNKVQLILAVFMIFRIMITVLQMIISPDSGKNESGNAKGGTKFTIILKRILLGLILLVLLRPVNIPVTGTGGQRQLNEYVANHGIIFGILYDLQYRILDNNNIGCIISSTSCNTKLEDSDDPTTKFSDYLVASFVHPNDDDQCNPDSDYLAKYKNGEMTADEFMKKEVYKQDCEDDDDEFLFEYNYVILFAGAGIVLYILIGFLIDVAIRSIKLSILRLISPIPVISYMANEKDQVLNNWVKNLVSTYVDLFVRLAIIFLAFILIGDILGGQSYLSDDKIGIFTKIVISIALLIFIKIAPKYITDLLGIKSTGATTLGTSALMGGTARLLGGGGPSGFGEGVVSTLVSSTDALAQGKAAPGVGNAYRQNSDLQAKIRTGDKDANGGLVGRLQDRLSYMNREHILGKYGMSNKDMALAKYNKDHADSDAAYAQENFDKVAAKYQNGEVNYDTYREAYNQNQEAQLAATKAKKAYDKIDKGRAQSGVAPRIIDQSKETYRSAQAVKTSTKYLQLVDGDWVPLHNRALDPENDIDKNRINYYNHLVKSQPEMYRAEKGPIDKNGIFIERNKEGKLEGELYHRDAQSFDGTGDDRFVAIPTSGPGPGPGGNP